MTRPQGAVPAPPPRPSPFRRTRSTVVEVNSIGVALARCEFCRELIMWCDTMPNPRARTPEGQAGKLMPMDPEPSELGRYALTLRGTARPQVGEMTIGQAAGYRAAGKPTYVQHVKSCAKADELRRGVVKRHTKR